MSRTRSRSLDNSPAVFLYENTVDLPWPEIQSSVGKTFEPAEQLEIFQCTLAFSSGESWKEAPTKSEIEVFIRELSSAAEEMATVAGKYRVDRHAPDPDRTDSILMATSAMFEGYPDLKRLLSRAGAISEEILGSLAKPNQAYAGWTCEDPTLMGLRAFILEIYCSATEKPARSGQPRVRTH